MPRALTSAAFYQLADVPPALTWFANIDNPQTRRAYQNDVEEFMRYAGITDPSAFRDVARAPFPTPKKSHSGRPERPIFLVSDVLHVFTQAGPLADIRQRPVSWDATRA